MRRIQCLIIIVIFALSAFALDDAEIFSYTARGDTDAVRSWILGGGTLNIRDANGNTPLLLAAEDGHNDIVMLLAGHGADINATNSRGYTPLMAAVTNKHPLVISTLFAAGADANIKNEYGSTTMDFVRAAGFNDLSAYALSLGAGDTKTGPSSAIHIPLWEKRANAYFAADDLDNAVKVLTAAADSSDSYAKYLLGRFYLNSGYTDLAVTYLTAAADNGVLAAQKELAAYYSKESELNPAYSSLAYKYTKMTADSHYPPALLETGKRLLYGEGASIDYNAAYAYFLAAQAQGYVDATYYIGAQHYFGLGMAVNKERGMNEILTAAADGSVPAQEQLKRFTTEQTMAHLAEIAGEPRASFHSYLLSQGALLTGTQDICDTYDMSRFMQSDYGIYLLTACYDGVNPRTMTFSVRQNVAPEYKEYLINYQLAHNNVHYLVDGE